MYCKLNFLLRIVTLILTIAFLSYDIAYTYPDTIVPNSSDRSTLAPHTFFDKDTAPDLIYAKILEHYIEDNGVPRSRLTLRAVKAALVKHETDSWFKENFSYTVLATKDGKLSEILISISPGYIIRYFNPRQFSGNNYASQEVKKLFINEGLSKQLLATKALPANSQAPVARQSASGSPVLKPLAVNPLLKPRGRYLENGSVVYGWEWYVFNPALPREKIDGTYYMIYRALSRTGKSYFGLAWSKDMINWDRLDWPIFSLPKPHSAEDPHLAIVEFHGKPALQLYYVDYDGDVYTTNWAAADLNEFLELKREGEEAQQSANRALRRQNEIKQMRRWEDLWKKNGRVIDEIYEKDCISFGEGLLCRPWPPINSEDTSRGIAASIWVSFQSDGGDIPWQLDKELLLEPDFSKYEYKIGGGTNIVTTKYGHFGIFHSVKGGPWDDAHRIDVNPRRSYEGRSFLFHVVKGARGENHVRLLFVSPDSVLKPVMPYDDVDIAKTQSESRKYDYTEHGEAQVPFPVDFPTSLVFLNENDFRVLYGSADSVISGAENTLEDSIPEYLKKAVLASKIEEIRVDDEGGLTFAGITRKIGIDYKDKSVIVVPFADADWNTGLRVIYRGEEIGFYKAGRKAFTRAPLKSQNVTVDASGNINYRGNDYKIGKEHAGKTITLYPLANLDWNTGFRVFDKGRIVGIYNASLKKYTPAYKTIKVNRDGVAAFKTVMCDLGNEYAHKAVTVIPYKNADWSTGFKIFDKDTHLGSYDSSVDKKFRLAISLLLRSLKHINSRYELEGISGLIGEEVGLGHLSRKELAGALASFASENGNIVMPAGITVGQACRIIAKEMPGDTLTYYRFEVDRLERKQFALRIVDHSDPYYDIYGVNLTSIVAYIRTFLDIENPLKNDPLGIAEKPVIERLMSSCKELVKYRNDNDVSGFYTALPTALARFKAYGADLEKEMRQKTDWLEGEIDTYETILKNIKEVISKLSDVSAFISDENNNIEEADLRELVADALNKPGLEGLETGIVLEGVETPVRINKTRYQSMIYTLCKNAKEAGAAKVEIIISPDTTKIQDNGTGIKREYLEDGRFPGRPLFYDLGWSSKGTGSGSTRGTGTYEVWEYTDGKVGIDTLTQEELDNFSQQQINDRKRAERRIARGTSFTIPNNTKPEMDEIARQSTSGSKVDTVIQSIHNLFPADPIFNDSTVLLSENIFMIDGDRSELSDIMLALKPALDTGRIAILSPEDIRKRAINNKVERDKMAIVLTMDDFNNKDIWNGSDKELSLRSSVLILDDKLTGNNYLYLGGVVGLARAIMANDKPSIIQHYKLLSGITIDQDILRLLDDGRNNNIAFALKAILRFKPIQIEDMEELRKYKIMVENFLIAA